MAIHVTPIPSTISLTAPAFSLGVANAAGDAITAVASNSTLLAYDVTLPDSIAYSQTSATGSAVTASRRDHSHGMAAEPTVSFVEIGSATAANSDSLTITGLTDTYEMYLCVMANLEAATNDVFAYFRVGDAAGVDSGAGDYAYHFQRSISTGTGYVASASNSATFIGMAQAINNDSGRTFGAIAWVSRDPGAAARNLIMGQAVWRDTNGDPEGGMWFGGRKASIDLDRVNVSFSSGDIVTGEFTVYGLAFT